MSTINTGYFDRVRYTLRNKNFDELVITEPEGWKTDEKEFARHEQYHGIFPKFSNSLKFVGDGAELIDLVKNLYGINEQIELIRDEKHPTTDVWTLSYNGFLDLSTWEKEDNKTAVKFNSGGIEQALKARESEMVEIDRLTTIDGNPIPALNTIDVPLDGRRIFLKTKFNVKPTSNSVTLYNQTNGQTRGCTSSVPLFLVNKSHENAHQPLEGYSVGDDSWDRSGNGETGNMFFAVSDVDRILDIKFSLSFKIKYLNFDDINFFRVWARLAHYENGISYNLKNNTILFTSDNHNQTHNHTFSVNFNQQVTLLAGESLALEFDQNFDGANGHSAHMETLFSDIVCEMTIDENSYHEPTKTKAVLIHEFCDRLVTIATNQENAFYSDLLGRTDLGYAVDGSASLMGFTHGFWVRGFDKLPLPSDVPKVENLFKPLSTSFKENIISLSAVLNVGIGIEKKGNREYVRLEDLGHFFQRVVTVKLPNQVNKVKRSISTNNYYSSLEFGYEKGGDYEEACGLDEFNAKSTFTTIINRLKNTFTQISKYRADNYGLEFARRKQKSLNDTEDTPYDSDVFWLDLKRGVSNIFQLRKWQDDFAQQPTGVFSPDTAFNLRLTPFNNMMRHSWRIVGCLQAYLSEYIRYGSSTANSGLKTQFVGKPEYAENGNVINSELLKARFIAEEIEFEHVCDFEVMQQINGVTVIFGKTILNIYGLIEFTNEDGELERGYLLNLKPNGNGNWKVLKANF